MNLMHSLGYAMQWPGRTDRLMCDSTVEQSGCRLNTKPVRRRRPWREALLEMNTKSVPRLLLLYLTLGDIH